MLLFLSYSFGTETTNTFIHRPVVPLKTTPYSRSNGQSGHPLSDRYGAKTIPFGAAHTYMGVPPGII